MKQQQNFKVNQFIRNLLFSISSILIISLTACNNQGKSPKLTKEDSVAIYKLQYELQERIYDNMVLTAAMLRTLFTPTDATQGPNAVKQLHFVWHEYAGNTYGLDAYGADENGVRLTDLMPLQYNPRNYVTNGYPYKRETLMVLRRGDLKYLLNSAERRINTPIGIYADIVFRPELRSYPSTAETMFFSIKKSSDFKDKVLAVGTVVYTNPSPPYNSICDQICDQE